jgi:FkbM family methyltransferase
MNQQPALSVVPARAERLVYDVGFNIGQDTEFYLAEGYRVVAIEADPTLAEKGRERFSSEVESGQLTLVNVGVAMDEGFADFWICEGKPEFNSFFKEIAARDGYRHHKITVPTVRFATLLRRYGTPYFLKIDIEGHDMLCLAGLDALHLPAYISIESECPLDGATSSVEDGLRVLRRLRELGYLRYKLIDQRDFQALSLPPSLNQRLQQFSEKYLLQPPLRNIRGSYRLSQHLMPKTRLERKFKRKFPLGCSGAWGENTPGNWLTFEEAERTYRHYRQLHFRDPSVRHYSFWCDWHAKH